MHTRSKSLHVNAARYAPILAALVFGGWAALVNSEYGLGVFVRTGFGQGIYALFSTWLVSHTVMAVMDVPNRCFATRFLSFASGFMVMVSIPLLIHTALGTPEIMIAIAPGILWGSFYIAGLIWIASRAESSSTYVR